MLDSLDVGVCSILQCSRCSPFVQPAARALQLPFLAVNRGALFPHQYFDAQLLDTLLLLFSALGPPPRNIRSGKRQHSFSLLPPSFQSSSLLQPRAWASPALSGYDPPHQWCFPLTDTMQSFTAVSLLSRIDARLSEPYPPSDHLWSCWPPSCGQLLAMPCLAHVGELSAFFCSRSVVWRMSALQSSGTAFVQTLQTSGFVALLLLTTRASSGTELSASLGAVV